MEPFPPEKHRSIQWKYLVYLVCLLVIVTWWIETPAGLLGKADAIGYAVCHRIEVRSFFLEDRPLPLCARCSGMYLGVVAGILFQLICYPRKGGMPGWKTGIPFIIFVLAFGIDGLNSYLHLFPGLPGAYEPNNVLRLITGTGMGISISAVLVPAFNQSVWKHWDSGSIFTSWRGYVGIIGIPFTFSSLILYNNPFFRYNLALISAAGVLMVLSMVYAIIWLMVFHKDNQAEGWRQLVLPLCAGLLTAIIQIGAIDWLRYALTGTWAGFKF